MGASKTILAVVLMAAHTNAFSAQRVAAGGARQSKPANGASVDAAFEEAQRRFPIWTTIKEREPDYYENTRQSVADAMKGGASPDELGGLLEAAVYGLLEKGFADAPDDVVTRIVQLQADGFDWTGDHYPADCGIESKSSHRSVALKRRAAELLKEMLLRPPQKDPIVASDEAMQRYLVNLDERLTKASSLTTDEIDGVLSGYIRGKDSCVAIAALLRDARSALHLQVLCGEAREFHLADREAPLLL
jgi:hypothetical protein